jgi:hypothetical protein
LELAAKTQRIVHIKGGKIQEETHAWFCLDFKNGAAGF